MTGSRLDGFRQSALEAIAALSMLLAGLSLVGLTGIVATAIGLRLTGSNLPSADDLASILLAGTFTLGFAAAVASGDHIRVLFFVKRLPSWPRWLVAAFVEALSVVAVGLLTIGLWRVWHTAFVAGSMSLGTLAIPRAVPIGVVAVGVTLLEIALVLHALGVLSSPPRAGRPDFDAAEPDADRTSPDGS